MNHISECQPGDELIATWRPFGGRKLRKLGFLPVEEAERL
jgi:hypothetical protein